VLRTFAGHLHRELRAGDVGGRWGGEEFLVILPHTDLEGAFTVAERIRSATAAEPVPVDGKSITVTISGGCALGPGGSVEAMVRLADIRLYQAKLSGRNQIATTAPPPAG
jgi:two-component system cell cycle response regulator